MHVVTYTPHGIIPDTRGFAPSLAAQYLAKHLLLFKNTHVCNRERHPLPYELDPRFGPIWRLREGETYRQLFRKATRLDPYPLHARLAKLLRGMPVNLLHAHQLEFPVTDFRRRLGRNLPVVIHAHAVRSYSPHWGLADAYIAVSDYTRAALIEKGFPAERVHVVYNGADTDRFAPPSPEASQRLKSLLGFEGMKVIAYVGRKEHSKGYSVYLKTLERLADSRPDVRGIAVGARPGKLDREPDQESDERRISQLSSRGILLDFPPLPHDKLAHIFQVADALLFPTQFSGEQHPLVLIEALSSGCVVITAPIAGIRETVGDETAVLLNDATSPRELAEATAEVLDRPERYADMRRRARETAVSRYDWRQQALQLERIYFDCLRGAGGI